MRSRGVVQSIVRSVVRVRSRAISYTSRRAEMFTVERRTCLCLRLASRCCSRSKKDAESSLARQAPRRARTSLWLLRVVLSAAAATATSHSNPEATCRLSSRPLTDFIVHSMGVDFNKLLRCLSSPFFSPLFSLSPPTGHPSPFLTPPVLYSSLFWGFLTVGAMASHRRLRTDAYDPFAV